MITFLRRFAVRLSLVILTSIVGHVGAAPPTLYLIGDSTVKNGRGDGAGGLWGWGQVLASHFDSSKIKIENRARGGRSSRTYLTEGLWEQVLAELQPRDFVLMQFGHNDGGELFKGNRPRASLKGNGEETQDGTVEATERAETVHSYGWYLRRYIADAKAKGAMPIVLSPVPRNIWKEGHIARAAGDYGKWAAEAAKEGGAPFIDLNELVAKHYESVGQETVARDFFTAADHTHTTNAGADVNAQCVVAGIQSLGDCPLRSSLKATDSATASAATVQRPGEFHFHFGGEARPGHIRVSPEAIYSAETGYGFEPGASVVSVERGGCTSDGPFYFSVAVPEGNYEVTATIGGTENQATSTIKAELRRLMIENQPTSAHEPATRIFLVNIRTPKLPDGGSVRLKDREKTSEAAAWDDKLTLEFNGPHPSVTVLDIRPADDVPTVYLAGDSTVADQPLEPWNSWGQMLPRFFKPGVAVANHAESGESIRSSLGARRFEKIFSLIKPGDYLFMQFGHNDMKDKSPDALATYRANLERIVDETRGHGATPVLVTSMERANGISEDTLGDYPQKVRDVARDKNVPLIDLNTMSKQLYRALGDDVKRAFQDGTHHNNYGSYELAKCVIEGIRASKLPLSEFIAVDVPAFDPAKPDPIEEFAVPASPQLSRAP